MFEVALTLCMLSNPSVCQTNGYGSFMHELECLSRSQMVIAEQVLSNKQVVDNWSLQKWGCRRK